MQDFPTNSQKAKAASEPREKVKQVTSAETVRRKRGLGHKFKGAFIGGDVRSAVDHVVFQVLIPSARDTLFEAFEDGLRVMIFGENARGSRRSSGPGPMGQVSYNYNSVSKPTAASRANEPRMLSRQARARHNFDDLVIPSRDEANEVLDQMYEWLSRYGQISVADLYEMTGIVSTHTDMKWGWTDLRGSKAMRLRQGGWLLDLPEPEPLG